MATGSNLSADDLFAAVGNTPLIRLTKLSKALGRTIAGKAEFLNPGGSVKDRAAKFIIEDAERRGLLQPGGTIVEGSAGNTGIALAMLGNARGYRCTIVVPDDQSPEKFALLAALGAQVRAVPAVPFGDERNYYHQARKLAESLPGAFWANQFNNTANRRGHYQTTGPEIWAACGDSISAFVASAGTGGTLAGVSAALKERNPNVRTVLADPMGSALYCYVTNGSLEFEGDSIAEGIGIKRITDNFEGALVDQAVRIDDATMVNMAHFLAHHEGLLLGGSAALNVAAAARVAAGFPSGSTVVTVLCDGGARSMSRLYNAQWLAAAGLRPRADDLSFL
ncbi:MAG: cysteine synthase A [Candidatus Eremiobacteraeota bacterium]|nr:cysteine synthase A [Candidatus Eremiobacteraeota bacterium]